MRAQELRIGNYIDVNSVVYKVVGIDLDGVMTEPLPNPERIIDMETHHEIQPIPLTEEWLVKFGFDERMHGWWSDTIFLRNDENHYYYWFDWNGTNESKGVYIKHVHQLQNLYFALTGEELTIKE